MTKIVTDPTILFFTKAIKGEEARSFVGREEMIRDCLDNLGRPNKSCVIYGERGIGKTSLGWQIATILTNSNARFDKKNYMTIGKNTKYKYVFHKCNTGINSIEHFLIDILYPTTEPFSFSQIFPKLYKDQNNYSKFERKYKFSSLIAEFEATFASTKEKARIIDEISSSSYPQSIYRLFQDALQAIHEEEPDFDIVFFIDEFDIVKIEKGLGHLIKNLNYAHFVFIGIADHINEIIKDHASASRELASIHVPELSNEDIRWIFEHAMQESYGGVYFSEGFLRQAISFSAGFPWIAQHLGYYAVYKALRAKGEGKKLHIDAIDFNPALEEVIKNYAVVEGINIKFSEVEDRKTMIEILEYIWTSNHAPTTDQIRSNITSSLGRFVDVALSRLSSKDNEILKKTSSNRWKFYSPIVRIFWRQYMDNSDHSV